MAIFSINVFNKKKIILLCTYQNEMKLSALALFSTQVNMVARSCHRVRIQMKWKIKTAPDLIRAHDLSIWSWVSCSSTSVALVCTYQTTSTSLVDWMAKYLFPNFPPSNFCIGGLSGCPTTWWGRFLAILPSCLTMLIILHRFRSGDGGCLLVML